MEDRELDVLLSETLGADVEAPAFLETRLRGELALARKEPKGVSLWWLPLCLTLAGALPAFLLGLLAPWPASMLLTAAAVLAVTAAAAFTAVGLVCFDLREKGRVALW